MFNISIIGVAVRFNVHLLELNSIDSGIAVVDSELLTAWIIKTTD